MTKRPILVLLAVAILGAAASGGWWWTNREARREDVRRELAGLQLPAYAPQKVVYHVFDGSGLFGRHFRTVLGSLRNHIRAVGEDKLTIRVVLQGPGVLLLRDAATDEGMRRDVDWLRERGIRFEVCRNSLVDQAVMPGELYGVGAADIVPAGVAELARLGGEGFTYLRL